jgi:putative endonuclease
MATNTLEQTTEFIALQYLRIKGYTLVNYNYKAEQGAKISIIVENNDTIVFVDVKNRKELKSSTYIITSKQQERLRKTAEAFILKHSKYNKYTVRFDAVVIEFPLNVEHIENSI